MNRSTREDAMKRMKDKDCQKFAMGGAAKVRKGVCSASGAAKKQKKI